MLEGAIIPTHASLGILVAIMVAVLPMVGPLPKLSDMSSNS